MSEQIVQVADASPSTKNMRTIQQTAAGKTVQAEVIVLATGAANAGDTYDARQIRTLTSSDVVSAQVSGTVSALCSGTVTANQGTANTTANAWPAVHVTSDFQTGLTLTAGTTTSVQGLGLEGMVVYVGDSLLTVQASASGSPFVTLSNGAGISSPELGISTENAIQTGSSNVLTAAGLVTKANASAPTKNENAWIALSTDLNSNLRTINTSQNFDGAGNLRTTIPTMLQPVDWSNGGWAQGGW